MTPQGTRTWRARLGIGALVLAAAGGASCTQAQTQGGASPSYLIVTSLEGASGASTSTFSAVINSDVVTLVKQTVDGKEVLVPTIYDDPGRVTFQLALRDPGTATTPTIPTSANFITVSRYHVEYVRADGRNRQGVDVPYAFDGAATGTISGTTTIGFVLVRVQAKEEAPLRAMALDAGAPDISTIANVTFYGTDQAGRVVTASGSIGVNFANWADPK